jgi:HPt (histidine-containing phosphotransfer) domain-containing protein
MATQEEPSLTEAMSRLWLKFLPQIVDRVATLETAAAALSEGILTSAQREDAVLAAHKLAGVLGTFGLAEGTALAREAEIFYSQTGSLSGADSQRLLEASVQLRNMIASRK